MDPFTSYYLNQAGGGLGDGGGAAEDRIGPVYRGGFSKGQRGSGFLSAAARGLWSFISPLFTSGARALGKEALNTGAKILTDAATNDGVDLKDAAKRRLTEGRDALVAKMSGQGRRKRVLKRRSVSKRKRKRRTKADIFESI